MIHNGHHSEPAKVAPALAVPSRDPAWIGRVFWMLAGLILLWPMLKFSEFRPWILFQEDNLVPTLNFLKDMVPPKVQPEFLKLVAKEAWRTVAIATAGLALAWLLAVPLALISVRVLSISALTGRMGFLPTLVRQLVRWAAIVLRSVPELIWALVFVRVVGLGPTSGVIAIGLTYGGMLGKVYAEILESGDPSVTQNLLRNGAGRLQAFFYGTLPQNAGELSSYTVYRWECAIRSSAVLGFVGAGGLGQQLDSSMKMFAGGEVSTMLLVFVFLVWLADRFSAWLRRVLM